MATNRKQSSGTSGIWATVVTLLVLLAAVLPPILLRGWLNRVPHLWQVFFPLLAVFAGYLIGRAIHRKEGWSVLATWGLLCAGAVCATVYHLLGGPHAFYTLGRILTIAFILAETVQVLIDGFAADAPNGGSGVGEDRSTTELPTGNGAPTVGQS